jgi:hypothetical protein
LGPLAWKCFGKKAYDLATLVKYQEPPKYWSVCEDNWNRYGNLRTVNRAFERSGYVASTGDEWDVLWTVEDPFFAPEVNRHIPDILKPHQRINHFPGNNAMASKSVMSTRNRDVKAILPGFKFPQQIQEFKEFIKANPNIKFVQKLKTNRGIKLVNESDISFEESDSFYQVFMERPLLVDDRAMDFSVFVLVASVNPLRIYRYEQELHLRFCLEPYYPFDHSNPKKYIIEDHRYLYYEMESLKNYYNYFGFSFKSSLEDHLTQRGLNVTELWRKIDEAIVQLALNSEERFTRSVSKRLSTKLIRIMKLSIV